MKDTLNIYLGLGSNQENALGNPFWHIETAIKKLATLGTITKSSLYKSIPMGPQDQPDYINAVVRLVLSGQNKLDYSPEKLLLFTQSIESEGQRQKKRHWGERSIDVDILLYADKKIHTPELTIPHIGITQRNFVAVPLLEITPDICIDGMPLADMPIATDMTGLQKL